MLASAGVLTGAIVAGLLGASPGVWQPVESGLWEREVDAVALSGARVRMRAFRVDLTTHRLQAVEARARSGRKMARVDELARESSALLAVNGTYFDERDRPLGLLVDGGRVLNPLRKADWGVFAVTGGQPRLVHTRDWTAADASAAEFAIQVGPRCVVGGEPLQLKAQRARRAVIGARADGHVVIAVSLDGKVLSGDLAELLARSDAQGGLGLVDAVMLDGGGSAQLEALATQPPISIAGAWPVPNAVAVLRREPAPAPR